MTRPRTTRSTTGPARPVRGRSSILLKLKKNPPRPDARAAPKRALDWFRARFLIAPDLVYGLMQPATQVARSRGVPTITRRRVAPFAR
jgi:hypothetical protein